MDIFELFFIVQFLVFVVISLARIYNTITIMKYYPYLLTWVLFAAQGICYAIGLVIVMLVHTTIFYSVLVKLQGWLFIFNFMLIAIETIMLIWQRLKVPKNMEAYNAMKMRGVFK